MNTANCPKVDKCPIFQGTSFLGEDLKNNLQDLYKKNYCQAGNIRFKTCKRYIASEALRLPIPNMIMPNSSRSVEEIREMIEKEMTKS